MELGSIKQKGGKIVHAWAFEGDLPKSSRSNQICSKWNGHWARVGSKVFLGDQARFFTEAVARRKLKAAQVPLLDRLRATLNK